MPRLKFKAILEFDGDSPFPVGFHFDRTQAEEFVGLLTAPLGSGKVRINVTIPEDPAIYEG